MVDLIKAVRDYANANYSKDGWDVLVECYSDAEIAERIGGAKTAKAAITKVRKAMKAYKDYGDDIRAA